MDPPLKMIFFLDLYLNGSWFFLNNRLLIKYNLNRYFIKKKQGQKIIYFITLLTGNFQKYMH